MTSIAIVCPVFREEEMIATFHRRLSAVVTPLGDRYAVTIVYVLDPSPDRTEAILRDIAAGEHNVELLVMSRRFGHQAALIAGIDHARADALIMLDSDLQHPPELIPTLIEKWEAGADIVQTIRADDERTPLLKRLTSRWFYRTLLRIGEIALPEGAADYRLISSRVADVFRTQLHERNPFLRGLFTWVGFTVAYIPYRPAERAAGASKYRMKTLMAFALNGICSFSKAPLRICTTLGLAMSALSVIFVIVQIGVYMIGDYDVPGWASLLGAVGVIGGVQLFFLGILGEYVGIIFDEVKARPRYVVARRVGGADRPAIAPTRSTHPLGVEDEPVGRLTQR